MDELLSKTTLKECLAAFKPGTHACFIHENESEHRTILTPFIRLGLEQGERVLYIAHDRSRETLFSYLADDGLEPAPFIESGHLFVVNSRDLFIKGGLIDPDFLTARVKDEMSRTLDQGCPALRVAVEASWADPLDEDSEAFNRYEAFLDAWVPDNPIVWLCQYDRRKMASAVLLHALTSHPMVIIGSQIFDNFYHIPPRERLGFDSEDTILDNWLQNLFKRKKVEDSLESRIRFQQIVTRLSASFVESGETDVKINHALSAIGTFAGVDRAYLFLQRPNSVLYDNTHEWCAPGIDPQIANLQGIPVQEELPWFWEQMASNQVFHIPDVYEIPLKGRLEQQHFESQGIQSLVVVPLSSGRNIRGFLGFDSVRQAKSWSENTMALLRITGQILASFLDRKETKKALHEREARYQTLTENLDIGVFRTTSALEDRFLEANSAMARIFGYDTREEILRVKPSETYQDPRSRTRLMEKLKVQVQIRNEELRLYKKDKTPFVASTSIVAVRNKEGEIEYYDGFIEDITERKRAEEAIYRSEKKFRDLFNAVSDLVYTQDLEGRFLSFNTALARILGYSAEEIIGRPASDFMKPELRPFFDSDYLHQIRENGRHHGVSVYFAKDGRKVYIEYRSVLVHPEDGSPYISGIGRDVTEKLLSEKQIKRLQEQILQSKKMEAIGTLTGGIAHDFNNILGIILGNAELALEDVREPDPAHHHLNEIRTASLRARDVVKQLLSFSRKTEQKRSPLKLAPLIKESLKLLRASIPANIAIETRLDADADPVLADPAQMHQVLINLCTNASHAMQESGGILSLGLTNRSIATDSGTDSVSLPPGRYVRLTVSDTGSGIEAEHLDRIFDPYFTTKEVGKGTGLGLSVVHGIVKNHEGAITVESQPGLGAVFSVYLPRHIGEAKTAPEKTEAAPVGTERVLFVDDEAPIVEAGVRILKRLGYRVEGRTNPLEALSLFSANPHRFDVVITDMTMPHMTGDRLAREVLTIRPDIPVILCTGFSHRINADSAARLGIKCYLEKPLNRLELARTLRTAIDGR